MNCIAALILYYSNRANFDAAVVYAVARQETNFNNAAVGILGERGIMQIRPEFIKGYTERELTNIEVNIKVSIELLKEAKEKCNNKEGLNWVSCYNHGIAGGNKVLHPENDQYVKNVTKYYGEYNGYGDTSSVHKKWSSFSELRTSWEGTCGDSKNQFRNQSMESSYERW